MRILAINPGGTSTKFAVFEDMVKIVERTVRHTDQELEGYQRVFDQYGFRRNLVLDTLREENVDVASLDCVVGRGGLLKPIPGGVYTVHQAMLDDVKAAENGEHACNLGCVIAKEIADSVGIPAFVVDPVAVDEFEDVARITGLADLTKKSLVHALNHKAVAKTICKKNQGVL